MASITKRKRDKGFVWRVSWRVGDGERRQETKTFDNHTDAKAHRIQMEKEVESRRVGGDRKISVFEYLDQWIAAKEADQKNPISPKTADGYRRNIGIFKRGLNKDRPLSQLDKPHIDKAYDDLLENGKLLQGGERGPMSKQTVRHVHSVLRKALEDAVDNKLITENPAIRADAPRVQGKKYKTKVRPFTKEETLLLFKHGAGCALRSRDLSDGGDVGGDRPAPGRTGRSRRRRHRLGTRRDLGVPQRGRYRR